MADFKEQELLTPIQFFYTVFEFERKLNFALSSEQGMTARACIDARIVQ